MKNAYLTFEINVAFKPESPEGLILFKGQNNKIDGDYITFGLEQGYPVFR